MMPRDRLICTILVSFAAFHLVSCGGKRARVASVPVVKGQSQIGIARTPDSSTATSSSRTDSTTPSAEPSNSIRFPDPVPAIVQTALAQIGAPYRWGGDSPSEGFDCSGLVQWTFAQHGIELPRSTSELFEAGQAVSQDQVAPADLVFYAWGESADKATHVGIYVGDGEYVHSPGTGRTVYRTAAFDRTHQRRFLGARRVIEPSPTGLQSLEESPEEQKVRTYEVRPGDYIWALARRYAVSPYRILELNGLTLDAVLEIGQKLLIPVNPQ